MSAQLVRTVEELDQLGAGSIIRGTVYYEALGQSRWHTTGSARVFASTDIHLPASVILRASQK